jgi:hypothetical protein
MYASQLQPRIVTALGGSDTVFQVDVTIGMKQWTCDECWTQPFTSNIPEMAASTALPTPVSRGEWRYIWTPPKREANDTFNHAKWERRDGLVFVAICVTVMVTLAAPMVYLWVSDRIKRRNMDPFKKRRDLESATRASQKRLKIRPGANPPPYRVERWRDTNPFHGSPTTKPPRAITADQILGTDKASYMRRIVPQSGSSMFSLPFSVC